MLKKTAEMARLRQTCCLGLPSAIVMPQILDELHQIVQSDRMHFAWTDRLGNLINGYFEKPDAQALDYFKHHHMRFYEDAGLSFRQALLFGKLTGNFRWPFKPGFTSTESHTQLFESLGLEHSLDGVLRDRYGPLGLIFLLRRKGEPDFSAEDEADLAQTLPYIAHAISNEAKTPESFVEAGDCGLMVFDAAGQLQYQSAQARDLCLYALADNSAPGWESSIGIHDMQQALCALFDRIQCAFAQALPADPPAWIMVNKWGEFQFRAYELRQSAGQSACYGVILKKKLPIEVWLLQKIKDMPLSNKQREVCFLLARGVETFEIARQLGISQTTLKEHIQTVYRKLGIRKREELLRLVLS
jgi:DNA-binding CsgD family transcriptional regulator